MNQLSSMLVGASSEVGTCDMNLKFKGVRPRVRRLMAGLSQYIGGIVIIKAKPKAKIMKEKRFCLPNRLVKLLVESF